jgi:hypothetical protein
LKKNLPFINDKKTFGEDDGLIKELFDKSLEEKFHHKKKYKAELPDGSLAHDKKFKPASLGKLVSY